MKHVPNALTLGRIVAAPAVIVLLLSGTLVTQLAALVLFILAAISDGLDGAIARKYGIQSRLGRFLDPLADKILVLGTLATFPFLQNPAAWADAPTLAALVPWWAIGLIAGRDLAVTALRSWAEARGRAIQTSYAAKLKTTAQLTFIIAVMLFLVLARLVRFEGWVGAVGQVAGDVLYSPVTFGLLLVAVALTLWTGALYFRGLRAPGPPADPPPAPRPHQQTV
jgi:CDP-diacylglycerol--glycerol-3-phosphate 3-phosphatidyltransferase